MTKRIIMQRYAHSRESELTKILRVMTDTMQMKRYSRRKHTESSHTDSQSAKQGYHNILTPYGAMRLIKQKNQPNRYEHTIEVNRGKQGL